MLLIASLFCANYIDLQGHLLTVHQKVMHHNNSAKVCHIVPTQTEIKSQTSQCSFITVHNHIYTRVSEIQCSGY